MIAVLDPFEPGFPTWAYFAWATLFGVPLAVTFFTITRWRTRRKDVRYEGDEDFASNDLKQRRDDPT